MRDLVAKVSPCFGLHNTFWKLRVRFDLTSAGAKRITLHALVEQLIKSGANPLLLRGLCNCASLMCLSLGKKVCKLLMNLGHQVLPPLCTGRTDCTNCRAVEN